MKTKLLNAFFALAVLVFVASPSAAQLPNQDWRRVETVSNKTSLIVETKTGATVSGKVVGVTSTTLNLTRGGKTIALERGNIAKVYRAKNPPRFKRALIGAAIGAGAGFGIGGIIVLITKGSGLIASAGLLYGTPIGAVIGGLTGGNKRRGELIYQSE